MTSNTLKGSQLDLDLARKPSGRGGWRPNAGRPKGRTTVAHAKREKLNARYPQHVTLRLLPGLPSLRRAETVKLIWTAIAASQRSDFRLVHFNVESNHLHFITEAGDKDAQSRGLQGLGVRLAKRLNRQLGRSGAVFESRYHSRALKTPKEVRNALRYVLNNARHHAAERGEALPSNWIDPYSSAIWFDGWSPPLVLDQPWKHDLLAMQPPTVRPTVWLLTTGWKQVHGPIGIDEIPGLATKRVRTRL